MIHIKFRIIEDFSFLKKWDAAAFDNEGDLEGFFALNFNGNEYGYYHNNPLKEDEAGFELITNWISSLVKVFLAVRDSGYAALNDIESYNTWIEFKLIDGLNISVSIIEAEKNSGVADVITTPLTDFNYGEWKEIIINLDEFKEEILKVVDEYIKSIKQINPKLIDSKRISNLQLLVAKIR